LRLVTPEDFDLIAQQLLRLARGGNLAAIKLLFSYVIGRPTDWVDPDTLDRQEYEQYERELSVLKTLPQVVQAPTPDLALTIVHAARPLVTDATAQELARRCADSLTPDYPGPDAGQTPGPEAAAPSANGGDGARPEVPAVAAGPRPASPAPARARRRERGAAPSTNGGAGRRDGATRGRTGEKKGPGPGAGERRTNARRDGDPGGGRTPVPGPRGRPHAGPMASSPGGP
jgi:hypothetical protein